ncbi:hypothetical protein [Aureibacillus halotolerans]|uniref:Putative NUDIX family phosphoesterase n=1 Tax=Aureibacillus halotolerans TaxID=1508390 RepID=A0A4R6UAF8_9BACI|nr:hypothetical protein [Aureibacillus halotolerans]TDQ42852.1 putative NUDIX family phosphoesterase [Aureibacillus halotolerans]
MGKMDEAIIVVPRQQLFKDTIFHGLCQEKQQIENVMQQMEAHYTTMRRGDAEENEAYKQPIPYVVVRRGQAYFVYERLSAGGEERLHNKLSLGVGGHQNPCDQEDFTAILQENLLRELEEELTFDRSQPFTLTPVGLINDDNDAVGRVHVGILLILDVEPETNIQVRETDVLKGSWQKADELNQQYDRFESWSQFVIDTL